MDDLLQQFLVEGSDLIQAASDDLLALARHPGDAARLDSAFRAFHTLKGSAGLFDLRAMSGVLHGAEDRLVEVRAGRGRLDDRAVDLLLAALAACERWMGLLAEGQGEPPQAGEEARHLIASLRGQPSAPTAADTAPSATPSVIPDWALGLRAKARPAGADGPLIAVRYVPAEDSYFLGDDPWATVQAVPGLVALDVTPRTPWALDAYDPFTCNLVIELLSTAPLETLRSAFRLVADQVSFALLSPQPEPGPEPEPKPAAAPTRDTQALTMRVEPARIDALADVMGELVVARNGLPPLIARARTIDPALAAALQDHQAETDRVVARLHGAVMRVRMVPLSHTLRRLPRLVRETATQLGKPVELAIEGGAIEVDRTIADGLFEPLLHVLRNAIDHGIEDAARREVAGKPPTGRITLRASASGNHVMLDIGDDGGGIDPARIRAAAVDRGVLSAGAAAALDDAAALQILFMPGFSTAARITSISGRGVGLDAVRTAIAKLGGRVELASTQGQGADLRITLPQALAVTPVLTVAVGPETLGVPLASIVETTRLPRRRVVPFGDGLAITLRERTIPLVRLADLVAQRGAEPDAMDWANVMVVAADDQVVGIEVDRFGQRLDALVRPAAGLLAHVPGLLGTALMADGSVLSVLHVGELIS